MEDDYSSDESLESCKRRRFPNRPPLSFDVCTSCSDREKLTYTNKISEELDTELGRWYVAKIDELLNIQLILKPSAYEPLMSFAALVGSDDYVLKR
jgi:hypothetical protein